MDIEGIKQEVSGFIAESFLFGERSSLPSDEESLIERGLIDSTGVLELAAFLEERYGLTVFDEDMVPENLDSVSRIAAFVARKTTVAAPRSEKIA